MCLSHWFLLQGFWFNSTFYFLYKRISFSKVIMNLWKSWVYDMMEVFSFNRVRISVTYSGSLFIHCCVSLSLICEPSAGLCSILTPLFFSIFAVTSFICSHFIPMCCAASTFSLCSLSLVNNSLIRLIIIVCINYKFGLLMMNIFLFLVIPFYYFWQLICVHYKLFALNPLYLVNWSSHHLLLHYTRFWVSHSVPLSTIN